MDIFSTIISGVSGILKPVSDVIDTLHTSDEEKQLLNNKLTEIKTELSSKMLEYESKIAETKKEIIIAEINSESWLTRNWRPVLMLIITAIIANNFILYPYLSLFTSNVVVLDLPENLYNLMEIGVGGYIVTRGAQRIVTEFKK